MSGTHDGQVYLGHRMDSYTSDTTLPHLHFRCLLSAILTQLVTGICCLSVALSVHRHKLFRSGHFLCPQSGAGLTRVNGVYRWWKERYNRQYLVYGQKRSLNHSSLRLNISRTERACASGGPPSRLKEAGSFPSAPALFGPSNVRLWGFISFDADRIPKG